MKPLNKKQKRIERQNELLAYFEGDFYQEKKIGDKWYVKMWNGGTERWQVCIYSEASFKKYKSFESAKADTEMLNEFFLDRIDI